eukprot:6192685-Pleurochrysis_carterae.AAC.1
MPAIWSVSIILRKLLLLWRRRGGACCACGAFCPFSNPLSFLAVHSAAPGTGVPGLSRQPVKVPVASACSLDVAEAHDLDAWQSSRCFGQVLVNSRFVIWSSAAQLGLGVGADSVHSRADLSKAFQSGCIGG